MYGQLDEDNSSSRIIETEKLSNDYDLSAKNKINKSYLINLINIL